MAGKCCLRPPPASLARYLLGCYFPGPHLQDLSVAPCSQPPWRIPVPAWSGRGPCNPHDAWYLRALPSLLLIRPSPGRNPQRRAPFPPKLPRPRSVCASLVPASCLFPICCTARAAAAKTRSPPLGFYAHMCVHGFTAANLSSRDELLLISPRGRIDVVMWVQMLLRQQCRSVVGAV
jgi:hypothetical protein